VNDIHHPLVNEIHSNNTNLKNTNLSNVKTAGREEVVENSKGEIKEIVAEDEEDINDIRRKIKESLKERGKCKFTEPEDSGKEKNIFIKKLIIINIFED